MLILYASMGKHLRRSQLHGHFAPSTDDAGMQIIICGEKCKLICQPQSCGGLGKHTRV